MLIAHIHKLRITKKLNPLKAIIHDDTLGMFITVDWSELHVVPGSPQLSNDSYKRVD